MGRFRLFLYGLGALAALLLVPAPASAARVLFVSDAAQDLEIPGILRADGHEVVSVQGDFAAGNAALLADLSGFAVVVWSASGNGYGDAHTDPRVFTNLDGFVRAGGRVLVTGYDSVASPTDPLLIAFLGATGSTDVPPAPGPVSSQITSLTFGVIDIRGVQPIALSPDRDTLTGLLDAIEIVGTSGAGGAQWTLRPLGRGEIAYVSNGDGGGSSASWSSNATDGSGVYNAALRNFASAAGLAGGTHIRRASADFGRSPRRARTLSLTTAGSPAILVTATHAWVPDGTPVPLSVCAASCHPVTSTRACTVPECPGRGMLLVTDERIADVSDFPRDREGWNRERAQLTADPELATIAWAFGAHPEPPPGPARPLRFLTPSSPVGWELHVEGGAGVMVNGGVGVGLLSASIGSRFQPRDLDSPLDVMYGNVHGVEARATLVPAFDGQHTDDTLVLVGIAPAFGYAFPDESWRVPSAFAFLVPELGAALTATRAPTYYFAWHVDAATLIDEHVGLDLRADLIVLEEWTATRDVETLLTLSVGAFFR